MSLSTLSPTHFAHFANSARIEGVYAPSGADHTHPANPWYWRHCRQIRVARAGSHRQSDHFVDNVTCAHRDTKAFQTLFLIEIRSFSNHPRAQVTMSTTAFIGLLSASTHHARTHHEHHASDRRLMCCGSNLPTRCRSTASTRHIVQPTPPSRPPPLMGPSCA